MDDAFTSYIMVAEEKYVITMKENESNESEKMDQNKKKLKIIAHATPLDVLFAFANLYSSPFQSIELAGTFFSVVHNWNRSFSNYHQRCQCNWYE